MKVVMILYLLMFANNSTYSQAKEIDSIFVEINKLKPEKLNYGLYKDKINVINVDIKNKYQHLLGFIASYSDSKLLLKKREHIPKEKVVEYAKFNQMLNKDFLNIYFHYRIYFIISEDKDNYLTLDVKPILPPELNKQ